MNLPRITLPGPLGQGGAPLGNLLARVPDAGAAATLDAAWACGIRLYDTAPFYGFGLSEQRFGAALRGKPRDEYVLSTKVGRLLEPDAGAAETRDNFVGGLPNRVVFDYSADGAARSIEGSLERLGIGRIDVVLIHDAAEDTHGPAWREVFAQAMAGAAPTLTRLREQGVIRGWGLGTNRVEPCLMALEQADPDVFLLAGRHTLLDGSGSQVLLPACAERGVQVIVGGPYNSGLLAGGDTFEYVPAPAGLRDRAARIGAVCARHGVDRRAAALQYCVAHPAVAAVIPGARTAEEVRQNAVLMHAPIPAALWDELRAEGLLPGGAVHL